jgi:hypothetical protein
MMEEAIQKGNERNADRGKSRPESCEQQNSAADGHGVKKDVNRRPALPNSQDCMGEQIETGNDTREQKPDAGSTPRKAEKESLHNSID